MASARLKALGYALIPAGRLLNIASKMSGSNPNIYQVIVTTDVGATYFVVGSYRTQRHALKEAYFWEAANQTPFICFYNRNALQWWYIKIGPVAPS